MKALLHSAALLVILCTVARAAPPDARPRDKASGRPARERADRPNQRDFVRDLQTDLKLTDAQRPAFERLAADYEKGLAALRQEFGGDGERIRDQIETARRSGDTAKAEQLRAQAREAMSKFGELRKTFLDSVEKILNDEQKKTLATYRVPRERRGGGGERGGGRAGWEKWVNSLPNELELTSEQRQQFDELVAQRKAALDQHREQVRPLLDELRQAREDGNQERVRELREQIEEARAHAGGPDAFFRELDPILTPAQREKLAALPKPGDGQGRGGADPRQVLSVANRLELTPEQDDQLREIAKTFRQNVGKPAQKPEERVAQADALIAEIKAILTPEQTKEFDELLTRADRRGPRGPRGADRSIDENADPVP
jgi:Spy/CpxP family protein refolding chaperone